MRVIVDRIEEEFAVCEKENRQMVNIPLNDIPFIVKEGDALEVEGNAYKLNFEETQKRKQEIENMTKGLWK